MKCGYCDGKRFFPRSKQQCTKCGGSGKAADDRESLSDRDHLDAELPQGVDTGTEDSVKSGKADE